jgi:glutathione S-transferase
MIELYKLHWSHYVEKVILALEFKKIPWRGVDVNAFSKKEMRRFSARQYVPLIHDNGRDVALSDSSRILKYLDESYPQEPRLFPIDEKKASEIYAWMVAMDSYLGIPARRVAYAQMLIERPTLMAELFLAKLWGGVMNWPGIRRISSAVVGMILITRFRLHRNKEDRVNEKLEVFLLKISEKLAGRHYLFGNRMTAADLTLAALLRPLRISDFFNNHPAFIPLFQHQERIFSRFSRPSYLYEEINRTPRAQKRPAACGSSDRDPVPLTPKDFSFDLHDALNDQQPVYHWKFLLSPYYYFQLRSRI